MGAARLDLVLALGTDGLRASSWQGLSAGRPLSSFDPRALAQGMQVEREHTPDPWMRARIAADHLVEHADYYTKLRRARL